MPSSPQDYVGPVGHEKKFHKTHFGVVRSLKKSRKNANWVYVGVGKWKYIPKETQQRSSETAEE